MLADNVPHFAERPSSQQLKTFLDRSSSLTSHQEQMSSTFTSKAALAIQEKNITSPYAAIPQVEESHMLWQTEFAHIWSIWHLFVNLAILTSGVILLLNDSLSGAGIVIVTYSLSALALASMALRFTDSALPGGASILLLLSDILALMAGMFLIGPQLELFLLLPGSLVASAMMSDRVWVILGSIVGFSTYLLMLALGQSILSPLLTLDAVPMRFISVSIGAIGFLLFLIALTVVLSRFRTILSQNAAYAHYLKVADRHAKVRRNAIDAYAVALQNELNRALQGEIPHLVTTCEELASLAQVVNSISMRLPGLTHDRNELQRLEKAIHNAIVSLEKGWAGFDWQWPAPSGTSLDRLIGLLRPTDPTFTAN